MSSFTYKEYEVGMLQELAKGHSVTTFSSKFFSSCSPFSVFQHSMALSAVSNHLPEGEVLTCVWHKDTRLNRASLYLKWDIYYKYPCFITVLWKDWETSKTGLPTFTNTASYTLNLFYPEINRRPGFKPQDRQHDFRKGLCSALSWAASPTLTINISLRWVCLALRLGCFLMLAPLWVFYLPCLGCLRYVQSCFICNKQYKIFVQFEAKNLTACVKTGWMTSFGS